MCRSIFKQIHLLTLLCLLTSCSSTLCKFEASSRAYQQGNFPLADGILSETIAEEMPSGNFQESNNAACLLLNRATTRFVIGDVNAAIADYETAIEALDYYSQNSSLETVGQILIEDGCGAYKGSDFEHVLARIYFALALLHKGDSSNAFAILRQAEEFQQRKRDAYASLPYMREIKLCDNAFGKYLFATLLEHRGDLSNANILYQQAQMLSGDMPEQFNICSEQDTDPATLLLICHNGNVPFKISATTLGSVASTVALEVFLGRRIDPAWSCVTGIPTPLLCQQWPSQPIPTYAKLDNVSIAFTPYFDVAQAAYFELEQKKPLIVARGVARYLLRRSAVAYCQQRNDNLGALVDLGMLIANANTKADTRAWSTLPSSIDLVRGTIPSGQHKITVTVQRPGLPPSMHQFAIQVKAHDLCVINIFNIHQEITSILVPPQYQLTGDTHEI